MTTHHGRRNTSHLILAGLLLVGCGGTTKGTTSATQPVAVAWTAVEPTGDSSDNVRVGIIVGGVAHDLGTARGDNIDGVQGPKACTVSSPSATETMLSCAAGLAYTSFVATLGGGQLVVVRREGVSADDAPAETVKGEPIRIPAAGATLTVAPYVPDTAKP